MNVIPFAIVGCGQIAPRHAEHIRRIGELIAVCDSIPARADALAEATGARAYYDFNEMLEREPGIRVVTVCTPNGLHAEHAIKSLQNGKHVVCEKPMCLSQSAGWSMRDTAHFFRRQLFVVKQNRYNPPVMHVKDWLEAGKLGRIVSVQVTGFWNREKPYFSDGWKGSKEMDGGILYTQFSHFIDLVHWFFGGVHIHSAQKSNLLLDGVIETEDNIAALGKLENGAICSFHFSISAYQQNREGSITILGEKGTVKIGGQYLNTLEYFRVDGMEVPLLPQSAPPNDYGFYQGSMSNHGKVYDTIVRVLAGQPARVADASDGLKTVETIEKIYALCL